MAVYRMENFDVDEVSALVTRGFLLPANDGRFITSLGSVVENGLSRKTLRVSHSIVGNGPIYYIGLPFPTNGEGYLSFRMRVTSNGNNRQNIQRIALTRSSTSTIPLNSLFWKASTGSIGPTTNGTGTGGFVNSLPFAFDTWYTIEVYRSSTGAYRIWVDDFLIQPAPGTTVLAPATAGFLYLAFGYENPVLPPPAIITDIADFVAVDTIGDGLKYRPGKTARVLPVSASSDVISEWTGGDGSPHFSQLANFTSVIAADGYITAGEVGKREQYQQSGIVPGFGQEVLTVGAEHFVNSVGGAVHTLTAEMDTGSGIQPVSDLLMAPGAGYVYRPVYLAKKPDGTNWTYADVAAVKSGFSIKS